MDTSPSLSVSEKRDGLCSGTDWDETTGTPPDLEINHYLSTYLGPI